MQTLNKTWFISDLHLDAAHPEITNQFTRLLESSRNSVDSIYILGDLFEAWIGDDERSETHDLIISALQKTTVSGVKIYLQHGNRDFLIGRDFLAKTGTELLPEEEKISLYGTPVLLMHGDTLCTNDKQYLRARKLMRNKIIQKIFLWLPLHLRIKIAAGARKASKDYTSSTDLSIMDVTPEAVDSVMQKHGVNHLIHGHTHRPGMHDFTSNNQQKCRIVLPAWHDGGRIFEWRNDNTYGFIAIK